MDVAGALDHLAPEPLDFIGGHVAEILVERFARFKLRAVDQDCIGAGDAVAEVVVVAEQGKTAVLQRRRPVVIFAMEPRDVFVDKFRCRRVVANNDEDGRDANLCLFPKQECLLIVAVERLQRGKQHRRESQRIVILAGGRAALLRQATRAFLDLVP